LKTRATKKLLSFVVFLLPNLATADLTTSLHEARNLVLFMRIPEMVCSATAGIENLLRIRGRIEYDQILVDLKKDWLKSSNTKTARKLTKRCAKECTCQIVEELMSQRPAAFKKSFKKVKEQSSKMTDKDYQVCQKRIQLNCNSNVVKTVMNDVRKESEL
jgi:hypothetical protein